MKFFYIYITVINFTFFNNDLFCQSGPPPAMAMPDGNNKILIDKIIETTKHEKYFIDYCTKKVNQYAIENNWINEKTIKTLNSINFEYYNSTIYNSYAFYSTEQLNSLLNSLILLDDNSSSSMILTNSMMQSNLDLYIESVIEGKYIITK